MKKSYLLLLCLLPLAVFSQSFSKQWVSAYSDTTVSNTNISDMVTDRNGNSYVAGYKIFTGDEYYQTHLFLLKVNAAGTQEWIRYFSTSRDSIDLAYAVALDSANNVYLTGKRVDTFCNICTQHSKVGDIITLKYDAAGNRLWLNRYHDSAYHLATPTDIQIAFNGAIVVTGNISIYNAKTGSYVNSILVQKLNSSGGTAWVLKQPLAVGGSACFDNAGNIIVAGASTPDNLYQTQKPLLFKLSGAGKLLWKDIFDEPNKNGILYSVGCDAAGSIYANGQTDTVAFYNNPRILTLKYNASGKRIWYRKEENGTTTQPHYYGNFAVNKSGTCYLTGTMNKSGVDDDWLTTSYNTNGTRVWQATHDDASHGSDKPAALTIDSSGNCSVAGYDYTVSGNYSISTVFYSNTGVALDSELYKVSRTVNSFGQGIGADSKGNVYTGGAAGYYNSNSPGIVVIRYSKKPRAITPVIVAKQTLDSLQFYPNPVRNQLTVLFQSTDKAEKYECIISDMAGNRLLATVLAKQSNLYTAQVDVHNLHHGMYLLQITNGITVTSKHFVKE